MAEIAYEGIGVWSKPIMGGMSYETDTTRHMTRWDPDRVLVECEAKRRIVELHGIHAEPYAWGIGETPDPDEEVYGQGKGRYWCETCDTACARQPVRDRSQPWCDTLALLALSYADHPDYREEWRP